MKKVLIVLLILLIILPLSLMACSKAKTLKDTGIIHEPEFGGVYIKCTIEDFNALGYEFGDSVDVTFSNGEKYLDLPYYNGYYVDAGVPLLVGYPGYDYIKVAINYGDDVWEVKGLTETDTATVKLNKKGKYKDVQVASDIQYFDEREKYTSDVIFANFRNVKMGNLKDDVLYRSASPCDNKHKRASYVDTLISEAQVQYILNLADTKEKIDGYIAKDDFNSPYFLSLYQTKKFFLAATKDDHVSALAMNMNYRSQEFKEKLVLGFKDMATSNGPYLVHCLEGKDRTGFVCIVLEALCGGTYQQIVDDYMLTYDNYYGINKEDSRYETIKARNVDSMLRFIIGDENADLTTANLVSAAENYMTSGSMTDTELNLLKSKLCN